MPDFGCSPASACAQCRPQGLIPLAVYASLRRKVAEVCSLGIIKRHSLTTNIDDKTEFSIVEPPSCSETDDTLESMKWMSGPRRVTFPTREYPSDHSFDHCRRRTILSALSLGEWAEAQKTIPSLLSHGKQLFMCDIVNFD